ncbi:hypothetical protein ACFLJY_004360 [Vibrio alginolyticus]
MRLSHKNKLLHKKGIPQRAWIGRHNRRILRAQARFNFGAKFKEVKLHRGLFFSVRSDFFVNAILIREKRTGRIRFDVAGMFKRIEPNKAESATEHRKCLFGDEMNKFHEIEVKEPEVIPTRELASGGFISPEVGIQAVQDREWRAVITPNDKETIQKLYGNRQQTIINRVVVTAKEEEANAGSVLSAIARSAVRVGSALKGVFFSKSKEKGAL